MKNFTICPECLKEYEDPLNRRFHASRTPAAYLLKQIRVFNLMILS
ncbi:MAG TPA: hypothetical protein G4O15_09285 [Dehalococcoidia bacterium]|nr:hypothetical protein [Dehalococcoidia bacterium]